ncbi:MAG: hypothetical protein AB1716_14380 [Planctomycetota bacterium]
MSKRIAVVLILLSAVVAAADVQIFFTAASAGSPWIGSGPIDPFLPSGNRGMDYTLDGYVPNYANFPQAFQPTTVIDPYNDFAYVWIKFTPDNGRPPLGAKLQGLDIDLTPDPLDVAYYVCDDTFATGTKRWDGDSGGPGWPNFKRDPQTLVAVTSSGIRNLASDLPVNLYQGSTRTALLGAVKVGFGVYRYSLGPLGINFHTGGVPDVQFGVLVAPEPAALALFAFVGLRIRRR